MDVAAIQRALKARLHDLGTSGPNRDGVDGVYGGKTKSAVRLEQIAHGLPRKDGVLDGPTEDLLLGPAPATSAVRPRADEVVPADWMPVCRMGGIVVHWTAGPNKATGLDREHYHLIVQGDGTLIRGDHAISANAAPIRGAYAAHCLNHNTGIIGVSLACMAGAVEQPFNAGTAPMTRTQWDKLPLVLADLCRHYGIPVGPRTVLSHAEVQGTLGITQRGKWDIARLAFDPSVKGAKACGDSFRERTAALLAVRAAA